MSEYCKNCYELTEKLEKKEQECEELKIYIESNEQQVKEVETLVMDNDRLINELDQLKEQLEAYKMEAEEGYDINAELKAENEKLKQTLEEIREIAKKETNTRMLFADKESFCDFCKILKKIDEVRDEKI